LFIIVTNQQSNGQLQISANSKVHKIYVHVYNNT